jgi:hypothetical protein
MDRRFFGAESCPLSGINDHLQKYVYVKRRSSGSFSVENGVLSLLPAQITAVYFTSSNGVSLVERVLNVAVREQRTACDFFCKISNRKFTCIHRIGIPFFGSAGFTGFPRSTNLYFITLKIKY